MIRRCLLAIALLASPGAFAQPAAVDGGIAVLPLRSRGLSPAEHKRLGQRVTAAFKQVRGDVIAPEDLPARLMRDERRRAHHEEARRLVAEGAERSLNLESAAAIAAFDRAISILREAHVEIVDPALGADAHLKRAAELLESDPAGARSDLAAAASLAPERAPSIDDYPPRLVEAYDAVRAARAREPMRSEDPRALQSLAAALGTASIAIADAHRADGVVLEVAVFAARLPDAPPRTARAALLSVADGLDRVDSLVESLVGRPTLASNVRGGGEVPRPNPVRTPPPIRRPTAAPPLWKNKWVWAGGAALAILGVGAGAYATRDEEKDEGDGFKVILVPAPPES